MNDYIKDKEDAIMILRNLLHVCETPSQNRLTIREKEAIKMGIEEIQCSVDNQ